ncbi:hypothetical protein HZS_8152 [Henneguya salminicola]|nr:hypothetical protein HZS_8152 [Henneguya salminicola]
MIFISNWMDKQVKQYNICQNKVSLINYFQIDYHLQISSTVVISFFAEKKVRYQVYCVGSFFVYFLNPKRGMCIYDP